MEKKKKKRKRSMMEKYVVGKEDENDCEENDTQHQQEVNEKESLSYPHDDTLPNLIQIAQKAGQALSQQQNQQSNNNNNNIQL
mmetsp:Transcript_29165/g.42606  ORF Transcript_29165/g.42606 Transcript_29165/m.42606 type:complete len:83 (+) Transcript_29165:32-280(+)